MDYIASISHIRFGKAVSLCQIQIMTKITEITHDTNDITTQIIIRILMDNTQTIQHKYNIHINTLTKSTK